MAVSEDALKKKAERIDCDIVALFTWAVAKTNKDYEVLARGLGQDNFGKYVTLHQFGDATPDRIKKQLKKCGWTDEEVKDIIHEAKRGKGADPGEVRLYIDPIRKEHRKAYETARTLMGRDRFKKEMWALAVIA